MYWFIILFSYISWTYVQSFHSRNKNIRFTQYLSPITVSITKLYYEAKNEVKSPTDIWSVRRKLIRTCLKPEVIKRNSNPSITNESLIEINQRRTQLTITVSTFTVIIGAALVRFGGRAALLQFLGLDFMNNNEIKEQMDSYIQLFDNLGNYKYLAFLLGWIIAKCLCLDFASLVLALSSGILFGGVIQGTIASVLCSSIASTIPFFLSRFLFRTRARAEIDRRPVWRAIDRACTRDGLKTVFVLRLSPLLPIPIGAYSYIYGATSLRAIDFWIGQSAGALKPYFLDSYLGVFGHEVVAGVPDAGDNRGALLLYGVAFLFLLVGTFSAQIAEDVLREIRNEVELERQRESNEPSPSSMYDFSRFSIIADLQLAQKRIENVLSDEWRTLEEEVRNGVDDVIDAQIDWNGQKVTSSKASIEYPGNRSIQEFEKRALTEETLKDYTLESLLFGWYLLSACLKVFVMREKSPVSAL